MFRSIKAKGGLAVHLAEIEVDYKKFVKELEANLEIDGKPNISRLVRIFNKDPNTINHWVKIYFEELKSD